MQLKTLKPFEKNLAKRVLKISICDKNTEIAQILAVAFQNCPNVEVLEGNILNLRTDALVSPANSFGDMGGGIDKAIDDFFAGNAQKLVQTSIAKEFLGEIPVGVAHIVPTDNQAFPFLIIAPTMRIPGNVRDSINAYLAMRAILVAVWKYNDVNEKPIQTLAIPSLCTGVGGMLYQIAAEQMRMAYENIINEQWKNIIHPAMAPFAMRNKFKA